MKTLTGGTVRYVGVRLLPCPEDATLVGQCDGDATLEVIQDGSITETFALLDGDQLLVTDGAAIALGTPLVAETETLVVRGGIPAGIEAIAQWSASIEEVVDVAGIVRARFAPSGGALRLELRSTGDGSVLAVHDLDPCTTTPIVRSQAAVRRGDRLAIVDRHRAFTELPTIVALRALLDGRPTTDWPAVVAPCRATVEAIEPGAITLRASDGRSRRLRHPRRCHAVVRVGDVVRAGDDLIGGERSHHALLHAWGEDRLADHLLDELEQLLGHAVPRAYWALAVRAMLDGHRVRDPGDTGLRRGAIVPRAELEALQRATRERNGRPAVTDCVLRGIGSIAAQRRR